jgi:hypothetical protein
MKTDASPVTVADFAVQAFIASHWLSCSMGGYRLEFLDVHGCLSPLVLHHRLGTPTLRNGRLRLLSRMTPRAVWLSLFAGAAHGGCLFAAAAWHGCLCLRNPTPLARGPCTRTSRVTATSVGYTTCFRASGATRRRF